ncbi:hypothetical protein GCM10009861_02220 [Neomicrococcus aestuarii]
MPDANLDVYRALRDARDAVEWYWRIQRISHATDSYGLRQLSESITGTMRTLRVDVEDPE